MMRNILEYLYLGETRLNPTNVKDFLTATKTLLIQDQNKEEEIDEKEEKIIADYLQTVVKSEDEVYINDEKVDTYDDEDADESDHEMEEKTVKDKMKTGKGRGRGRPPKNK